MNRLARNIRHQINILSDAEYKDNVVAQTKSNNSGYYSLTKIRPGQYYILVRADFIRNIETQFCPKQDLVIVRGKVNRLSILAARGEIFVIKASDNLYKNINFICK